MYISIVLIFFKSDKDLLRYEESLKMPKGIPAIQCGNYRLEVVIFVKSVSVYLEIFLLCSKVDT
jgi:hypothetical protein